MSKILIFGDSYSYAFKHYNISKDIIAVPFFAEYILNLEFYDKNIRKIFTDSKNNVKTVNIINETIRKHKNDIKTIIFLFGNVDINFSYFYNRVYGVPYNRRCIISSYIKFVKKYTKYCKNVFIINFLPLFVDTTNNLTAEFKQLHIPELFKRLNKNQINEIFNIKKYREHLYNSNKVLKYYLKKHKNIKFIPFNEHIYKKNKYHFKDKYYITEYKKRHKNISITLDFHINAKQFLLTFLEKYNYVGINPSQFYIDKKIKLKGKKVYTEYSMI